MIRLFLHILLVPVGLHAGRRVLLLRILLALLAKLQEVAVEGLGCDDCGPVIIVIVALNSAVYIVLTLLSRIHH